MWRFNKTLVASLWQKIYKTHHGGNNPGQIILRFPDKDISLKAFFQNVIKKHFKNHPDIKRPEDLLPIALDKNYTVLEPIIEKYKYDHPNYKKLSDTQIIQKLWDTSKTYFLFLNGKGFSFSIDDEQQPPPLKEEKPYLSTIPNHYTPSNQNILSQQSDKEFENSKNQIFNAIEQLKSTLQNLFNTNIPDIYSQTKKWEEDEKKLKDEIFELKQIENQVPVLNEEIRKLTSAKEKAEKDLEQKTASINKYINESLDFNSDTAKYAEECAKLLALSFDIIEIARGFTNILNGIPEFISEKLNFLTGEKAGNAKAWYQIMLQLKGENRLYSYHAGLLKRITKRDWKKSNNDNIEESIESNSKNLAIEFFNKFLSTFLNDLLSVCLFFEYFDRYIIARNIPDVSQKLATIFIDRFSDLIKSMESMGLKLAFEEEIKNLYVDFQAISRTSKSISDKQSPNDKVLQQMKKIVSKDDQKDGYICFIELFGFTEDDNAIIKHGLQNDQKKTIVLCF
jgi:hypothetical protein